MQNKGCQWKTNKFEKCSQQEKEAQLSTLRDTMDNNEAAILKVHEEKREQWEEETSWLRKELQDQEETSRKIQYSLQTQVWICTFV